MVKKETGERKYRSGRDGEIEEPPMRKLSNEDVKTNQEFVGRVLGRVQPEHRQQAEGILIKSKALETYGIMKDRGLPETTMRRIMAHGMNDIARGKHVSVGAYAMAIAEELTALGGYSDIVDEMHEEGVLSDRQYHDLKGTVREQARKRAKLFDTGLEGLAKAAVWILMFLGGILMLFSSTTITGAVTGPSASQPFTFILGFVLFVIGLLLYYRKS